MNETLLELANRIEHRMGEYKKIREHVLPFNGDEAFTVALSIVVDEIRALCDISHLNTQATNTATD